MNLKNTDPKVNKAIMYLITVDKRIKPLVKSYHLEQLDSEKSYLKSLVRSIIFQQLSGRAAKTIFDRFMALFLEEKKLNANEILSLDSALMRSVGISSSKVNYIKNIAKSFVEKSIDYPNFSKLTDDQIIESLVSIKGVGRWTAQMFLIFTLKRPDVFPEGDLGVRKGFQLFYNLEDLPSSELILKRSEVWSPYRSFMARYFWKVSDDIELLRR